MPKRRSNTISTEANVGNGAIGASGSGMSPGIINDLASRINQRLTDSIIVHGDSRSRGRNEEIRVAYDEDEDIYIVDIVLLLLFGIFFSPLYLIYFF